MSEVRVVRRRRSRAEALVADFEVSGLRREAFCQQRDLAVGTLDSYRRRVRWGRQSGGGPLLPVELVSSTAGDANSDARGDGVLVVELRSGRRIEVRRGFDAATLERLLTVVERV